jgi:hypothetical protein
MTHPRTGQTATLLHDGRVLLAGGDGVFPTAELYDPALGTFSPTGTMIAAPGPHGDLARRWSSLIQGGQYPGLPSAELYDPATGSFSGTGDMLVDRYGTATLLADGRVLFAGGQDAAGPMIRSAELYDPAVGRFTLTGSMQAVRSGHTSTLLPNGQVLIFGGDDYKERPEAELYDAATGTFTAIGGQAAPFWGNTATLLGGGHVLIAGGIASTNPTGNAELYDPASRTFSATGAMTQARFWDAAVALPGGRVLMTGGMIGGNPTASAELYDPAAGTFSATTAMTAARYGHTSTVLKDGRVLMAGGGDQGLASAEIYGPSNGGAASELPGGQATGQPTPTATVYDGPVTGGGFGGHGGPPLIDLPAAIAIDYRVSGTCSFTIALVTATSTVGLPAMTIPMTGPEVDGTWRLSIKPGKYYVEAYDSACVYWYVVRADR